MIITVTMNPAIDKTVEIDRLEAGGLNRISKVELDAGGKGINVSKTIKQLGGNSIATGFLGGNGGRTIQHVLENENIKADFVWVDGETRTNTKVLDKYNGITELNEPGPDIKEQQIKELLSKLEAYADIYKNPLFVLAGSIPKGVPMNIYRQIIKLLHAKGAKVLLDADGKLFMEALEEGPDIIKPNRFELQQYAGYDYPASPQELVKIARGMMEKGVKKMAVSLGSEGALMIEEKEQFECPAVDVKTHSTVGAGDAMVAAMAYAEDEGMDTKTKIRLCMATSAGAVTTIGTKPPTKELVEQLMEKVVINKF